MPFLLTLLTFGKGIGAWLSRRSLAELAAVALIFVCVCQYIVHTVDKRHIRKVEAQLAKCTEHSSALDAEIKRISSARNTQKSLTKDLIVRVERTIHDADERAKVVEQAPPATNCKTKPEVLNADV